MTRILAHNEAFLELAPRVALSRLAVVAEHYVTFTPTVQ